MKYAFFDVNGNTESTHDDETIGDLPAGAFVLDENQWASRWQLKLNNGLISEIPLPTESIENKKTTYKNQVDVLCGAKRASIISPGNYIAEEYRRAYEDALAFQAASFAGQAPASVQVWATVAGITPQASADEIIATRNGYMALLDAIRAIRLTGKAAVDASTTPAQITAALDSVNTSLAAL